MKIGIVLPIVEGSMDGGNPRWSDVAAMTRAAEDVGFDSAWLEDHLIFRFPERPQEGPWESFSLVAALAAITSRIELATLVTCTSFRNPALTAKKAEWAEMRAEVVPAAFTEPAMTYGTVPKNEEFVPWLPPRLPKANWKIRRPAG